VNVGANAVDGAHALLGDAGGRCVEQFDDERLPRTAIGRAC
jgi:hypothetical protein